MIDAIDARLGAGPVPIVRRRRLIARLHDVVHHRLLLVVAPAGYGKTTLLSDFAANCAEGNVALTLCTYTAVSWDADGLGLLAGIARAFADQVPGAGQKTLRLLEQAHAGAAAADLDRLLTSATAVLVQEVAELVPDYSLLVVDDYHLLDESDAARRLFAVLLERLPAHVHLAFLSRTVPSLDTSALVADGQAAALGPRDLAFSEEEIALFLSRRYGIDAEPEQLEEVRRWTEGWITGLLLAMPALPPGLSQEPAAPARRLDMLVRTLSGARRGGVPLNEYLAAEMLRQQAPEDRDLLLAAALPEQVAAAQLDEVIGSQGSALALSRLERGGVPLAGVPDQPGHFRLHALLRQYLRAHLERADPARHEALRRRWTEMAETHQQPDIALEHALVARWWPRAAALLEKHGDEWIDRGRHRFVDAALGALPADVLATYPRVQVCRGRLTYARGDFPGAVECAREAFFNARARRDRSAEARALLLEAVATLSSGRSAEAQELCLHALELSAVRRNKLLLAEAYRCLGVVEAIRGLLEPAAEHLQGAVSLYEASGRVWDVARLLGNLGVVSRQLGRPEGAERFHTRALAIRRGLGDPVEMSLCLNNLAVLRLHRGGLEEAEAFILEAIQLSEQASYATGVACWQVTLGDVMRALRRPDDALRSYRTARAFTGQALDPRWTAWSLLGEAAVYLDAGSLEPSEDAARQALDAGTRSGLREIAGHACVLLGAAALRRGQRREANQHLDAARLAARETGSKELQARVHLWSGLNALQQKRAVEAAAALQLAAEAAAALGGPTALALEGVVMEPLLRLGLARRVAPDLVGRALDLLARDRTRELREVRAPYAAGPLVLPRAAPATLPAVRIRLFGDFEVHVADDLVEDGFSARSRTRELLAYLAVFPEGRRREEITDDLWPDAEPGQDKTLIQVTIHRLRQALFRDLLLAPEGQPYLLNPAVPLEIDVRRFEQSVAAARAADPEARRALLVEAVEAYRGPFLISCYADWAEFLRRRLEREYAAALAQLVKTDWDAAEYRRCLLWCHRLLEIEPDDEAIHARIVECHSRLGEPLAAALHRRRRESVAADAGGAGNTRNMV